MRIRAGVIIFAAAALLGFSGINSQAKQLHIWSGGAQGFSPGEQGRVGRVIDGDSFVLESGLKITLAGIQAPKLAWPEKNYKAWPLAVAAKSRLRGLVKNQKVQLYYSGDTQDRYGRALAQVWTLDSDGKRDIWLQQAMAASGFARAYSYGQNGLVAARLLGAEQAARASELGIWDSGATNDFYGIRSPEPNGLAQYVDSVQIVEGIVISAAEVRGTIYLNFGSDYKTDFTIAVSKKSRKAFKREVYDLLDLIGARVRVRGWIELRNGPIIWLSLPQRLEILD